jgi:hypothetical protein
MAIRRLANRGARMYSFMTRFVKRLPHAAIFAILLAVSLTCASCTFNDIKITAPDVAALATPPKPAIPLRVGLYIPPGLKDFNYTESIGRGRTEWLTGVEIQAMIENSARRMFREVVALAPTDTTKEFQARNLDAVVSVGSVLIKETPAAFAHRLHMVDVSATWDISTTSGKIIFSSKPVGHGERNIPWPIMVDAMQRLMKEASVAGFADYFGKVETEIQGSSWWKDESWRSK